VILASEPSAPKSICFWASYRHYSALCFAYSSTSDTGFARVRQFIIRSFQGAKQNAADLISVPVTGRFAKEMVDDTRRILNESQDLGVQGSEWVRNPMAAMASALPGLSCEAVRKRRFLRIPPGNLFSRHAFYR
jgi:hypothetical protein